MSIFWKIVSQDGKVSYLFGTFHTDDLQILTLPREVKQAFDHAKTCAFEYPCYFDEMKSLQLTLMQDTEFSKWKANEISPTTEQAYQAYKDKFKEIVIPFIKQRNADMLPVQTDYIAEDLSEKHTPIGAILYIFQRDPSKDFLDKQLIEQASQQDKNIAYLDDDNIHNTLNGYQLSFKQHMAIFNMFVEDLSSAGSLFGDNCLFSSDGYPNTAEIKAAYLSGSLEQLLDFGKNIKNPSQTWTRYTQLIGEQRDRLFVKKIQPLLQEGEAFIAVGAAHLKGMLELLSSQGYHTEPVSLGAREYPINIENFKALIQATPLEELPNLLDRVMEDLSGMFNSSRNIGPLLYDLDEAKFPIVFTRLKSKLQQLINTVEDFYPLIMSEEKMPLILDAFQTPLIKLLNTGSLQTIYWGGLSQASCNQLYNFDKSTLLNLLIEIQNQHVVLYKFSEAQQDIARYKVLGDLFKSFPQTKLFAIELLVGNVTALKTRFDQLIASATPGAAPRFRFFETTTLTTGELEAGLLGLEPQYKEKILRALDNKEPRGTEDEIKRSFELLVTERLPNNSPQTAAASLA